MSKWNGMIGIVICCFYQTHYLFSLCTRFENGRLAYLIYVAWEKKQMKFVKAILLKKERQISTQSWTLCSQIIFW